MRRLLLLAVPVAVALLVVTTTATSARPGVGACKGAPEPFKEATLIVETNATDVMSVLLVVIAAVMIGNGLGGLL